MYDLILLNNSSFKCVKKKLNNKYITNMITDFTQNPEVIQLADKAKQLRAENKRFSDIEDAYGNQYVDLVQEGGGVLGIALVGYTYVLENAGIRFFSLAGTSAGAINTLMIAGLKPLGEAVSENIIEILSNKNLFDIVDGDRNIKRLIQKATVKGKGIGWDLAFNALRIYNVLKSKLGINPGNDFEKWISLELKKANIESCMIWLIYGRDYRKE
jgi:NTE family protein